MQPKLRNGFLLLVAISGIQTSSISPITEGVANHPSDMNFRRDIFGVFFDPPYYLNDKKKLERKYSDSEIFQMLDTVSVRFSKLLVRNLPISDADDYDQNPEARIPRAAAKLNVRNNQSASQNIGQNTTTKQNLVQLYLGYMVQIQTDNPDTQVHDDLLTSFYSAKNVADNANDLFKNTVKYLITAVSSKLLKKSSIQVLTRHLTSIKQSNTSNHKYKMGVRVDIDFCGDSFTHMDIYLRKVLPLLDLIIFEHYHGQGGVSCGISSALHCTQTKMQKCREKMSKLHPHLELAFSTEWERQEGYSKENDVSNMVYFWSKMNAWAGASNITVIMYQAFDEPYQTLMGWWEMETKISTNITNTFREQYASIQFPTTQNFTTLTISTDKCLKPTNHTSATDVANFKFSRTHFGVLYNPFVKITDNWNTYDEEDFLPFIEKISTRFTNILITCFTEGVLEELGSVSSVPIAVARYNRKNFEKPHFHNVQVFMMYRLETYHEIYKNRLENKPSPFDLAKQAADNANLVYPGTVNYLLLQEFNLNVYIVDILLLQLEYVRRQKGNFTYNLGLTLKLEECDENGILNIKTGQKQVTRLIRQVSLVVFDWPWASQDFRIGTAAMLEKCTTIFSTCSSSVKLINPEVKVGFMSYWPDTDSFKRRNITALTWFWAKLNDWAIKTNNFVFMKSAFDTPVPKKPDSDLASTGWWKFVKDRPCYNNTREYRFVEKLSEGDHPIYNLNTNISNRNQYHSSGSAIQSHTNFLLAEKYNLSFMAPLQDELNFDKEKFGVFFQPYVNKDVTAGLYSEEDVKSLLKIVRTRFSKLLMMPINKNSKNFGDSTVHIPKAAAKLNKIRNGIKSNTAKELQVFVSFHFDPLKISDEDLHGTVDLAMELADEANNIFVNTVPSILLVHQYLLTNHSLWAAAETQVKYFRQKAHLKTKQTLSTIYQNGALLEPIYCESDEYFAMAKKYLLLHLDFVVIRYFNTHQLVNLGVEESFGQVVRQFGYCKEKIIESFHWLKVGFMVQWTDTESTWKKYPFNLVRFWRMMNTYAVANDTLVFLGDAFDNPNDKYRTGWWRLVEESNLKESKGHYVVQEKYQLVSQSKVFNDNDGLVLSKDDSRFSNFKVAMTTVSAGLGVVVIVCVLGALVIWKYRQDALTAKQRLSEGELIEFFQGSGNVSGQEHIGEEEGNVDFEHTFSLVKRFAYDTSLEVPQQAFVIDESLILGSGAFGTVYMARICKDGREVSAAVKRVKSGVSTEMSVCSLRSLLSEVKVLSFIGQHENIVKLLAVYTADIRNGNICVFLEPCTLGALKKHLGTLCKATSGTENDDYLDLQDGIRSNTNFNKDADTSQLLFQWSLQIAQGMEFLASKQVVHADLATRNVLLDRNKVAKICDFGLSRRMYNNESYVKSKQEPLPWRWMPPESLRRWEFCESSDVWAYGVTLWEIYTLGEVPYAGLEWDQGFFCRLEEGLCPREPMHTPPGRYNEIEMYREVMLKCWEKEPNSRPTFSNIVSMLIDRNFP